MGTRRKTHPQKPSQQGISVRDRRSYNKKFDLHWKRIQTLKETVFRQGEFIKELQQGLARVTRAMRGGRVMCQHRNRD